MYTASKLNYNKHQGGWMLFSFFSIISVKLCLKIFWPWLPEDLALALNAVASSISGNCDFVLSQLTDLASQY